ncbi:DUF2975 domain-containing protein [Alkalihalobacillus sp. 1P02AB]|uniref:DUF2975 domain-containing protein n=1 Tax=Alkalihalobacillus sp. 1P02AB TaxID=3132260 RepID=UPI0039A48D2F
MTRGKTTFLKVVVILIGIIIFALSIFWLPWIANESVKVAPEYAYLHYPVLIGLYVTTIPFFFALYQALRLLKYIEENIVFSNSSVIALKNIKCCAILISILYVVGSIFLVTLNALHPGIGFIGIIIIFASLVIAVFSAVLQTLLEGAINIKLENDLTV